jgi:hypothetical protein
MAVFVPPQFSKFGKGAADLLEKRFDYKTEITVANNLQSDVNVESTVTLGSGALGDVSGKFKAKYKNRDFGEFEGEVLTKESEKKHTLSGELKFTELAKGLTVSLKGTDKPNGKVGVEYKQENVAVAASADVGKDSQVLEASAVAGFDNFSVGGSVAWNAAKSEVTDFGFGSEFSQPDYVITVRTKSKADTLLASYYHNIATGRANKLKTQVGVAGEWKMTAADQSKARSITIGTEHDVDETTTIKAKIDTNYQVAALFERRLTNPWVKVAASALWDGATWATGSHAPQKFGVALTFGDY